MQSFEILNVYVAVGAGVAIWWTGQKCGSITARGVRRSKLGRCLSFVGLAVFAVGMYAGFKGPLTIAGITLETFPFASMNEQASAEALSYAQSNLDISREPAPGWHAVSKTDLQLTIRNNGNREVGRIAMRFSTGNRSVVDLPLRGPFPARKTITTVMKLPSNVDRSYFNRAKVGSGEIVSAQY